MAPAPDKVHNLPLDRDSNKKKSKSDYQTQDDCPLPSGLKFKPYKLKLSVREYQKRQEILWFDNVEGNSATSQSHTQFTKYYNLKNGYSVASPALKEPGVLALEKRLELQSGFPSVLGNTLCPLPAQNKNAQAERERGARLPCSPSCSDRLGSEPWQSPRPDPLARSYNNQWRGSRGPARQGNRSTRRRSLDVRGT